MRYQFFGTTLRQKGSHTLKNHKLTKNEKKKDKASQKFKAMLIVFFDIKGVFMEDWVPEESTMNQYHYKWFWKN